MSAFKNESDNKSFSMESDVTVADLVDFFPCCKTMKVRSQEIILVAWVSLPKKDHALNS